MKQRYFETPLGLMHLQESSGRILSITFCDDEPAALVNDESILLDACVKQLQEYFDGQLTSFELLSYVEQPGTAFQHRVWTALCNINYGKTISYRALAITLGDEKCIRAAASANGQNNIAIAVPCHRVIGSDGSLTGYAGGLWRKKWLLDHEAKHSGRAQQATMF